MWHISAYRHSLALPEKRKRLIRQKRVYESEDNTGLNQTRGIVVNQEEKCSVLNGNILDYQFILIHIFCINSINVDVPRKKSMWLVSNRFSN